MDTISTALAYVKHLEDRPAGHQKPVVFFTGTPLFDTDMFEGHEVAHVHTVNHEWWGADRVRTSSVIYKFDDGSFETMNTIYRPYTDMEGS